MTDTTVIVHDGRLPGGAGAVVLARLLRSVEGEAVEVHHLRKGQNAEYFWTSEVNRLIAEGTKEVKLILFGVTYYDLKDDVAGLALERLAQSYGELEIWSHRWPDGYSMSTRVVHIPPNDIVYGPLGIGLMPAEKTLLRLSLVAARAVPVADRPDDLRLVQALAQWTQQNEENWDRLVAEADLDHLFHEALAALVPQDRHRDAAVIEEHDDYIDLDIDGRFVADEIDIIEDVLRHTRSSPHTVVIAWLGQDRVLLCRRDPRQDLPALRWLIDNRYQSLVPAALRGRCYGPQDSAYFRLYESDSKAALRPLLRELAKELAAATSGGRYLTAALARDIAALANQVFNSLDLTGRYTATEPRSIEVAATDLYDLIHTSSRTGERRRTLTMPIRVTGARATAFVYMDGGYNAEKAERMLEGALLGLGSQSVDWLGIPRQSGRLRLDIRPFVTSADGGIEDVRAALREPRIKSIKAEGLVADGSVIGKFLKIVRLDSLVTIADSETIGPSFAHALTLLAAAEALKDDQHGQVSVLDLFAGSGVAYRLLSAAGHPITSVDLYVSASSVGLNSTAQDATRWLRANAGAVLDANTPLIEGTFDVIGLDPPHSELMELLFGSEGTDSLVRLCARRAKMLVLYQGHSTQRGRLPLIMSGLREAGWMHRSILQVEEELIVVAATSQMPHFTFRRLVGKMVNEITQYVNWHEMGEIRAGIDQQYGFPGDDLVK